MSQRPDQYGQNQNGGESDQIRTVAIIVAVVLALVGIGLIALAFVLALNATTAGPGVEVVRDILIIALALEFIIIGAAVVVFLIQAARLINLLVNEINPLVEAVSDTVNTLRGTAAFLSKNLAEPVVQGNAAVRGIAKVVGDVEAVRKAAGIVAAASSAMSPTGTHTSGSTASDAGADIDNTREEDVDNTEEEESK